MRGAEGEDSDLLEVLARTEALVQKTVKSVKGYWDDYMERWYGKAREPTVQRQSAPDKPEALQRDPWGHKDPWTTVFSAYRAGLSATSGVAGDPEHPRSMNT